ncbi:branched-chain amino acid ABC transporter permease [Solidesulfovibrio sp.]|uniref:branched-chain amino acid ABC transporter permease n=1 Tax=Solidesulfovibrio sp. TaxID=2910990 RepID=UPI000EC0B134|nr:branched-chain amino acid ABC transporter permease [Solidesulfovibrio sp.]MEA5088616.1 branched-chain amino acid ABC transporter permease [Solidesulfovibrio sp.]HCR11840.1 branched-chain amino acid ABC transporter permease [Desulfovibrio sp.]
MKRLSVPALLAAVFAVLVWASQTGAMNIYWQSVVMFMGVNIILSSSLNIINGNMGEFSCGHAGFMAVGAYVSSVLSVALFAKSAAFGDPLLSPHLAVWIFPLVLLAGALAASLVGLLVAIPSFKTRGDYLAIITIAAAYIVKSTIENIGIIGGARGFMGMSSVMRAMNDTANLPWIMIWVVLGTIFSVWLIRRFIYSTFGKGVDAISQDEIAAEIMSVDTDRVKLVAFMVSCGLAGLAGGLFAHILGYVNPGSFTILKSTEVMVMVYLGGMGSLSGSVLSAILITLLMEALRPLQIVKWVVIPLLLVLLMQFRPEGIMGRRELADVFPGLRKFYKFKG